jgi:hypothetical protein
LLLEVSLDKSLFQDPPLLQRKSQAWFRFFLLPLAVELEGGGSDRRWGGGAIVAVKKEQRPFLEHVEAYLARRDGVDKALKILRYTTKVLLASPLAPRAPSELSRKLKDFEASVGTSRKAFRLGKFIQNVNALKKTEIVSRQGFLGLVANGGEGFYFFVEQFIWLVRSGTFFLPFFL